jgi:hypothetical protein
LNDYATFVVKGHGFFQLDDKNWMKIFWRNSQVFFPLVVVAYSEVPFPLYAADTTFKQLAKTNLRLG